jgi:hypothetical protein
VISLKDIITGLDIFLLSYVYSHIVHISVCDTYHLLFFFGPFWKPRLRPIAVSLPAPAAPVFTRTLPEEEKDPRGP